MAHNYIYESKVSNLKIEHVENKILGTADYHRFYIVLCDDIQIAVSEHLTAEALTELIEGRDIKLTTLTHQRDEAIKCCDKAVELLGNASKGIRHAQNCDSIQYSDTPCNCDCGEISKEVQQFLDPPKEVKDGT